MRITIDLVILCFENLFSFYTESDPPQEFSIPYSWQIKLQINLGEKPTYGKTYLTEDRVNSI